MKDKFDKIVAALFIITVVWAASTYTVKGGIDAYKALNQGKTVDSFEVKRGEKSMTCISAWVGTQATLSCVPTQLLEVEVTYDQADFEAPAEEFEYPKCGGDTPPQDACWTEGGQLFPGYVLQ